MSKRETYLFIDAEYLKQRYRHYMQRYFGEGDYVHRTGLIEEIALETIKSQANAQKVRAVMGSEARKLPLGKCQLRITCAQRSRTAQQPNVPGEHPGQTIIGRR